jgi:hypothetical protein
LSISRETLTTRAKQVAQDPSGGANLLLAADDYNLAIDLALDIFKIDRPNVRTFHYTVPAAAVRFVLHGTGKITASSGLDKWIDGGSSLQAVYTDFDATTGETRALEADRWRVRSEPGPLTVLVLVDQAAAGGILRLEFVRPHELHATTAASSSIRESDVTALVTLTAVKICEMTARRYVQNTGTSTFQNDSVDRRSQSDQMAARAKDLFKTYAELVGRDIEDNGPPAAGVRYRLGVDSLRRNAPLWRR